MAKGPLGRDRRAVAARVKPGWVRVSFNYFLSDAVADYVMDAARLVAPRRLAAARGLPDHPASGSWTHRSGVVEPPAATR